MSRMLEISFEEKLFLLNSSALANTPAGYCIIKQNGILVNAPMGSVTTIIFDTIAEVEALDSSYRLVYCKETNTFYEFDATSGETVDSEFILNTSAGGSTRWVGVSGEFTRILTNFFDGIQFGLTPINTTPAEGKLLWNSDDGTLELGLPGGNVALQIGEETLIRVKKATGQTILNGDVVYISGASGQRAEVSLADADSYNTSFVLGVATEDIGTLGYVTLTGLVRGINTLGMTEGSPIWLSQTAGKFTTTRPTAPAVSVFIGYVIYEHATEGIISVRPQIVPRLIGLSDVYTETPTANEILQYNATNSRFELTDTPTFSSLTISNAPVNNTDAVNKLYADNLVVGLWDDRGSYDASGNTFPATGGSGTAGAILKGDIWTISVAGTLGGVAVDVGDTVRAVTDTPGQTASNWALLENNMGYVPENTANKATTMTGNSGSNILYLTAKAIYDWATGLFQTLSNLRTSFQATPDDTHYPSEKLVKDSLDAKQDTLSKASGSDIDTGTDNDKYVTPKAIADSKISFTDGTETLTSKTIDLDNNTILNAGNILIGENLLDNSNFINNSTYGYGFYATDNWNFVHNTVQGGFPECTKQQLMDGLGIADGVIEGLWNLQEVSGDAVDLSSNTTDLIVLNDNAGRNDGPMLKSRDWSGSFWMYTSSVAHLLPTTSFTWSMITKFDTLTNTYLLSFNKNSVTYHIHTLELTTAGKIIVTLTGLSSALTSDVTVEVGKTYNISVVYDGTTLSLFINGIKKSISVTGTINNTGIIDMSLGRNPDTNGLLDGFIQNLIILSTGVNDQQAKKLWYMTTYKGMKLGSNINSVSDNSYVLQVLSDKQRNAIQGKTVTFAVKTFSTGTNPFSLGITLDNVALFSQSITPVANTWETHYLTATIPDKMSYANSQYLGINKSSDTLFVKEAMLYEGTTPVSFWNASQNDWQRFPRLMRMDPPADLNGGYHFEEKRWFDWVPEYSNLGTMTVSEAASVNTYGNESKYQFDGREMEFKYAHILTIGGTPVGSITVSLPSKSNVNGRQGFTCPNVPANVIGSSYMDISGSPDKFLALRYDNANFTAGNYWLEVYGSIKI